MNFASYTGLIPKEHSSGEKKIMGHINKHAPSLLRFFLVETAHSLIKYTKKFKSKYLSIVRRLGKKRSIIAIARILAETIYAMLKNNVKYIERERSETINPDECSLGIKPVYDANLSLFSNLLIVPISDNIPDAV